MFAPHYAAPMPCTIAVAAPLTAERDGEPIGTLAPGERFEVLELTTDHAWGVAADGTVGYVGRAAFSRA